jgi:NitT/TauT family transport system ATP-binding protein
VELVGELRGMSRPDRQKAAVEAIAKVGLSDFADDRPSTLSGGMRMRASLARTLITRPELMLFDEPFSSLDELTRAKLCDDVQSLFVTDQFAGLLVTHSIAEAVYLAERVLVMTDRPGRFAGEVPVPFDYPRPPDIRYTPEFAKTTAGVYSLLQPQSISEDR